MGTGAATDASGATSAQQTQPVRSASQPGVWYSIEEVVHHRKENAERFHLGKGRCHHQSRHKDQGYDREEDTEERGPHCPHHTGKPDAGFDATDAPSGTAAACS